MSDLVVPIATSADRPALDALVERSFRTLGAAHGTAAQIEHALGPAITLANGSLAQYIS